MGDGDVSREDIALKASEMFLDIALDALLAERRARRIRQKGEDIQENDVEQLRRQGEKLQQRIRTRRQQLETE